MNAVRDCLESLGRHIRTRGPDTVTLDGDVLQVAELSMEFRTEDVTPANNSAGYGLSVVFEARSAGSLEPGIRVLAVGSGATAEKAAIDAGHQWAASVLPPLMSYLLPDSAQDDVYRMPMVVGVPDAGEHFAWTAHLGPVVARSWGAPGTSDPEAPQIDSSEAFQPIFNVVHSRAAHHKLMWVESFAIRYPGKVDATCRLVNEDWGEGRDALLDWAASWPDPTPFIRSRRQFVVLQPAPRESVKEDVIGRLDEEMRRLRRPWWKLWGGGA